jgi:hypothetical protein
MGLDPKVKNLIKFLTKNLVLPAVIFMVFIKFIGVTDYYRLVGQLTLALIVWKAGLTFYRRMIEPAKNPLDMGKWAIVTGNLKFIVCIFQ